jgi:hypothetical protein
VELTPISARTLRRSEVILLAALYWPLSEVDNAAEVARLESAYNTAAHNTNGEDSRGLWQINVAAGAHPQLEVWNLFDPMLNAYFAHQIWSASGWRAWYNSARSLGLL